MVYKCCEKKIGGFWCERMSLYEMTKEELIVTCKRLQSENKKLHDELDKLSDCYIEMEIKIHSKKKWGENFGKHI